MNSITFPPQETSCLRHLRSLVVHSSPRQLISKSCIIHCKNLLSSGQKSTHLDISILFWIEITHLPCDVFRKLPALPYSSQQSGSNPIVPHPQFQNKKNIWRNNSFFMTLVQNPTWNVTMVFIVFYLSHLVWIFIPLAAEILMCLIIGHCPKPHWGTPLYMIKALYSLSKTWKSEVQNISTPKGFK